MNASIVSTPNKDVFNHYNNKAPNRHKDSIGSYYEMLPLDEFEPYKYINLKMIAADENGKWHASKRFLSSNGECRNISKKPGNNVVYNYVVFQSEEESEPFVVIGSASRHTQITNCVFSRPENYEKKIRFAGEIAFDETGSIAWWDDRSGHYKPLSKDAKKLSIFPYDKFWSIENQNQFFKELSISEVVPKKTSNSNEMALEISKIKGKVSKSQAFHAFKNYERIFSQKTNGCSPISHKRQRLERHRAKYMAKKQKDC